MLDRLEEWLQTEWPDLRVYCTSVTEQWATVAVDGPRARDVLARARHRRRPVGRRLPVHDVRATAVAGMPARVARVSFTGELAYEINVAGWHGLALWEAVMAAGEPFGITPYGTEAMHVLRAEKGFVIVGPGHRRHGDAPRPGHVVDRSRRTSRTSSGADRCRGADTARPDRKQLVGLLPVDPDELLPEGAQLAARARTAWRRRCRWWATSRRATAAPRWAGRSRWRCWPADVRLVEHQARGAAAGRRRSKP